MSRRANIEITNFLNENKFKISELSEAEKLYISKHTPKTRKMRTDLTRGDLVVACEGKHMGQKLVFIKQLEGNKAVVSGIKEINNIGMFIIDEQYLFKLSINVSIPEITVNGELNESKIDDCCGEFTTTFDNSTDKVLYDAVKKVEFLKGYISEPFVVDNSIDFYSQKY